MPGLRKVANSHELLGNHIVGCAYAAGEQSIHGKPAKKMRIVSNEKHSLFVQHAPEFLHGPEIVPGVLETLEVRNVEKLSFPRRIQVTIPAVYH